MKRLTMLLGSCFSSLFFWGCATSVPTTVTDLTVSTPTPTATSYYGTLSVSPIKSDSKSAHLRKPIDTTLFQEALSASLRQSGYFSTTTTKPGNEFTLETEIIHQAPVDAYSIVLPLLVHYKLRETRTGKVLWSHNTFSLPRIPYSRSEAGPTGAKRHRTVVNAAIRDSFAQIMGAIGASR